MIVKRLYKRTAAFPGMSEAVFAEKLTVVQRSEVVFMFSHSLLLSFSQDIKDPIARLEPQTSISCTCSSVQSPDR